MEKMRLIVLVDMAAATRHERKIKREFEERLFKAGFNLLQEGVYTRLADGRSNAELHRKRLRAVKPEVGNVRLIVMTERQFQSAEILSGEECAQETEVGSQLDIFFVARGAERGAERLHKTASTAMADIICSRN